MRRTALLAAGLGFVMTLGGAAHAVDWRPRWAPVQREAAVPETVGRVESVANGVLDLVGARRTMTLRYPGADYVKVHFSRFGLLPGSRLTVADPSGQETHTYTEQDLTATDGWATSVSGDTAVVTLQGTLISVHVDKVARGLTASERTAASGGDGRGPGDSSDSRGVRDARGARDSHGSREESICGRYDEKADAACYKSSDPVAYAHAKPVARLLIDGIELCTAWRVGPNNRMFTNHHCFASTREARRTEVWFNYECAECGGFETLRPVKVLGDRVLATDPTLDYTLFTLQHFDAVERFGYLLLDVRELNRGEELYIPQHPRGEPTVIAMEDPGERSGNCAVADPIYDGYERGTDVAYYCDTEGGSSGSPVISRETNGVIALHHFGGCPNSGVRIDLIFDEVHGVL
jgi:lysyl endopeptidase